MMVIVSPKAARAHKTHLRLRADKFPTGRFAERADCFPRTTPAWRRANMSAAMKPRFVDLHECCRGAPNCTITHFSNACGFDAPEHYSTAAEDLAAERDCVAPSRVQRIGPRRAGNHHADQRASRLSFFAPPIRLLGPDSRGARGKDGFTSKAGRCLIAKVSRMAGDLLLVISTPSVAGIRRPASSITACV